VPVDSTHPQYDAMLPVWRRMRDAVEGEDAIRAKGAHYLPAGDLKGGEQGRAYRNYLQRARYPEAVADAIDGMVGLMGRKPAEIALPERVEGLKERATPDGLPLDVLLHRARTEVCTTGRHALLVDLDDSGEPVIAEYRAETLINWRADGDTITLAVFYEEVEGEDGDEFERETVEQYRVCRLDAGGFYAVELYRRTGDEGKLALYDRVEPLRKGERLTFVPVVPLGSRDLLPAPDAVPLRAVANKSLHYYRQYADYAQQLHWSSMATTPYMTGIDGESAPSTIGPGTMLCLSDPSASVGFLETSGQGGELQREELRQIETEIARATVQALSEGRRQVESGEALRLRFQSQTATLASIATSTAEGLKRALRWCAWWAGADEDAVTVEQSTSFISESPDAGLLNALYEGVDRGQVPLDVLHGYLRRTELTDMDAETLRQWTPAALGIEEPEE